MGSHGREVSGKGNLVLHSSPTQVSAGKEAKVPRWTERTFLKGLAVNRCLGWGSHGDPEKAAGQGELSHCHPQDPGGKEESSRTVKESHGESLPGG